MEAIDTYEKFITFVKVNKLQYTLLPRNYSNYSNSILSTFIKRNFIKTPRVTEHHDTKCHQVFVPMVTVEIPMKSIVKHDSDNLESTSGSNVFMYIFTYSNDHATKELSELNELKLKKK